MDVERIEDWAGREVVDSDGEKIGKLEDVYYAGGSTDAVLACVKTGMLGRKLYVVPLADAAVTRDHVKVAYTKSQVTGGPRAEGGAELGETEQVEVAHHYEVELPGSGEGGRFESGQGRRERRAKIEEMSARAGELDKVSAEKREQAEASRQKADESARDAERVEQERREAEEAAARLRREGDE
jgi:PRC-barrel domain